MKTLPLAVLALSLAIAPPDTTRRAEPAALPSADLRDDPAGRAWLERYVGGTSWECTEDRGIRAYATTGWRREADDAAHAAARALPGIAAALGVAPQAVLPLWILVSPRGEGVAREAPTWSAALAQPERRLILLSGPDLRRTAMDLDETVAHEIAHVVLHSRLGEIGWVPRWFDEGLAMRLSGYGRLGDRLAQLGRGPLDLHDLADRFPRDPTRARQAYLESEAAVRSLQALGPLAPLLDRLAAGEDFEPAFEAVYGESFDDFAADIAAEVPAFWRFLAVMRGTGLLWTLGAGLVVLGAVRVRSRNRRRLREWEAAESRAREPEPGNAGRSDGTAEAGGTNAPTGRAGPDDSRA